MDMGHPSNFSETSRIILKEVIISRRTYSLNILYSVFFFLYSFYLFIYLFFNFIFKLYIIVLFLPNIKMNPPQAYMCSPS